MTKCDICNWEINKGNQYITSADGKNWCQRCWSNRKVEIEK